MYNLTKENPFVACESLMAFFEQGSGREPAPYTGFIGDDVLRKLGYSLVDGSILGLAFVVGTPGNPIRLPGYAGNCRKNICSHSLQEM